MREEEECVCVGGRGGGVYTHGGHEVLVAISDGLTQLGLDGHDLPNVRVVGAAVVVGQTCGGQGRKGGFS